MEDLTKNFNGRGCQCFRKTTQPVAGRLEAERLCQCSRTMQDNAAGPRRTRTLWAESRDSATSGSTAIPRPKRNGEPTGQDWAEGPGGVKTAPLPCQRPVLPAVHAQLEGQGGQGEGGLRGRRTPNPERAKGSPGSRHGRGDSRERSGVSAEQVHGQTSQQ